MNLKKNRVSWSEFLECRNLPTLKNNILLKKAWEKRWNIIINNLKFEIIRKRNPIWDIVEKAINFLKSFS